MKQRNKEKDKWKKGEREGQGGKEEKTVEKTGGRGGQFAEFAEITLDWVLIPSMWEFQTLYYIMNVPLPTIVGVFTSLDVEYLFCRV